MLSLAHEEQYTYVRLLKKEARVAELLEGTRQLALKVQDEACKDPDFDIARADIFIAKFQEFRGNLKIQRIVITTHKQTWMK